ncbi:MAG: translocation/assembly module TamB domain-containing protein [Ferruginibacter sp.]|nr:translocation/assembly module TamB domain-containing protein [Ferruginibacter sp.]
MLVILILLITLIVLINLPPVQTWLVKQAAGYFSDELGTKVSIKKVNFRLFNKLVLEELLVEDKQSDTLLFAGAAQVNVTDWFFVKDKITLKYLSLEDAKVHMKRTDSVWNYQFIADYFAGPKKNKKKKSAIEFNLKELHFNRVHFIKEDRWIGQRMAVSLEKAGVWVEGLDMKKQSLIIREIALHKPVFEQSDFQGNRPTRPPSIKNILKGGQFQWNNGGWNILLRKLNVTAGAFKNDKETLRDSYVDQFDGQHIHFTDINGSLDSVVLSGDTVRAIAHISTKEKSGLHIRQLNARLHFSPVLFEFKDLLLETDKSTLGNYYSMSYESFKADMGQFIHNVYLDARFERSTLNSDDLAIFAPALKNWKRVFNIHGKFKGTVDNFSAREVDIQSGMSAYKGTLAIRGLPDMNSTFLDIEADALATHYYDAIQIMPALRQVKQPRISSLGAIQFTGSFTGFLNDFVTHGVIKTHIGTLHADLNMKLPEKGVPAYSGTLSANRFNIGRFLNVPKLGPITFKGNVAGVGFSANDLNMNFDGTVSQMYYNGKPYTNISVVGDFDPKFFKGHLSINDPKLRLKTLDGTIRLEGEEMEINADADLEYADLQALGISKDSMQLKGLFNVNFTGSNIDNFLGYARITNAELMHEGQQLSFDSLTLNSWIEDDIKHLSLSTNELDASITGKFNILDLPNSFKFFLSRYYPNYIGKPDYAVSDQDFTFQVETREVAQYVRLFDKRLNGFNDAVISGKLDIINSELDLKASIPGFSYQDKQLNHVELTGEGNSTTVSMDITAGNIKISDSLQFPKTQIKLSSSNDISFINIKTSADKTLNDAELNASVQTLPDGVKIRFFPSSFILNDKKWELAKDGELTIRKQFVDANEIRFVHKDQQIIIDSELSDETDQTHLTARLQNVRLQDFTPLFMRNPKLSGAVSGKAKLSNLFGKQTVEFEGSADSFALNDRYIGSVTLDAALNNGTGELTFDAAAKDSGYDFQLSGEMNLKDSTRAMAIQLDAEEMNLEILEPFLGTIFSDMKGIAKTNLKVYGEPRRLFLVGDAYLDSASFLIAYTQCRYSIARQRIQFNKDEINLGRLRLTDTLGNSGTLTGKIGHEFFDKLYFDNLRLETSKMMLLNTNAVHNEQFYGSVIGYANMQINGPLTNLVMNIKGQPNATDTSYIYLPTGSTSLETATVDYIEFVKFGELMEEPKFAEETNILVILDIDATPSCKVNVILDEETGDVLKAQGNGKLSIRVGNKEPMSMRGRYVLTKGEYNFNFQTFLQKPFLLTEGGSISWNGDPYQAIIDIEAEYIAKRVDVSVLATAGGYRQREDVTIVAQLTGVLQKPDIQFDIQLPDKSEIKNDYIAAKKLADFRNDQAEMYKQVASLLLFNSFIAGTQSFLSAENTLTFATSTIGGIMSGLLTNMLNKELERATKGILSTYVEINPTINLQTAANQLQANVKAGLTFNFSKRLFMLVGGNLEYNNPATLQLARRGLLTPDITIEWLLNKDGSLRIVGFNRTSIDLTIGQRNRSGVQLSYRKDFNRLTDIFKSKKQIEALNLKRRNERDATHVKEN